MSKIIKTPLDKRLYQKPYSRIAPWRGGSLCHAGWFLFFLFYYIDTYLNLTLNFAFYSLAILIFFIGWLDHARNLFKFGFMGGTTEEKTYTALPWKGKKLFIFTNLLFVIYIILTPLSHVTGVELLNHNLRFALITIALILMIISAYWYYTYSMDILKSQDST
jgi:hypothetical protein